MFKTPISIKSPRGLWIFGLLLGLQWIGLPRAAGQPNPLKLCRLKYNGGGDWYSSRTALPNLAKFANSHIGTNLAATEAIAEVGSTDIFRYPYCFLTGHGNVVFSDQEAANLRNYLIAGGFLHICDNYGIDPFIRREMKKTFPELTFQAIPFHHPIYQAPYSFSNGLPKVHQHDGKAPIGYGLFWEGRLICFYDYECDLGNGWEDPEVYKDPTEIRDKALKMGCNLIYQAFINQ
ncbi:hypothetical protein LBMAG26_13930 [Bacteroidota bacterium]|nr:hypothetical protein LBMAG26_13930 [Bacteroidota bacterium]